MTQQPFREPAEGVTVDHLVCFLARELEAVKCLTFFVPPPVPLIQDRLQGAMRAMHIVDQALALRTSSGLPFWDAANLSSFEAGSDVLPLLEQALFHNDPPIYEVTAPVESIVPNWLRAIADSQASGTIVALSSRVETVSNAIVHIPMLDFHCPESAANLVLVETALRALGVKSGFIVKSGKSFHFYGRQLVSEAEQRRFLSRALLLAPIVDRCWIAHQLLQGACGLRISPRTKQGGGLRSSGYCNRTRLRVLHSLNCYELRKN